MKILAVAGSLQTRSSNKSLVELGERIASQKASGLEWVTTELLGALPHYNADVDGDSPPGSVARWRAELAWADAIFFASPEYGHGMPGVLKNALDWIIGSGSLFGKPVAATCAGAGPDRGKMGLAMLVQTLNAIDAVVVWNAPIVVPKRSIQPDGVIGDESVENALRQVLRALIEGARQAAGSKDT